MTSRKRPPNELKVTVTCSRTEDAKSVGRAVRVPTVDVAALHHKTGLSQRAFADSIGVSEGTLMNWEQRRRFPSGPAKVPFALLARKPSLVQDLLPVRQLKPNSPIDMMTDEERFTELGRIIAAGILRIHEKERRASGAEEAENSLQKRDERLGPLD